MYKYGPNIIPMSWDWLDLVLETGTEIKPGYWAPSRPISAPTLRDRFKAAWLVFTGKADALIWPGNQ